jgi:hypothetical protein
LSYKLTKVCSLNSSTARYEISDELVTGECFVVSLTVVSKKGLQLASKKPCVDRAFVLLFDGVQKDYFSGSSQPTPEGKQLILASIKNLAQIVVVSWGV